MLLEQAEAILRALIVVALVAYILYETPQLVRERFAAGKRSARDPSDTNDDS
jgi:hypothetical protein